MKILCFIDSLGSGGAQRQMVELAKGFKEKGHSVVFLTYHDSPFFKPELDAVEIPLKVVVEPNYLKRVLKIRKVIRGEKPDAVLSFLEPVNFMATIAGFPFRKWKLVVGERSANPEILTSFKRKLFRWCHFFADYIVANSASNLAMVYKINPLLNKKKGKVIYNIISEEEWKFKRKNINFENLEILFVGRYHPVKNLENAIRAIHTLPEEYKKRIKVNFFGDKVIPSYFNSLQTLIDSLELNNVIKLNSSSKNILVEYEKADFVGLVSHHEGFPNTVCEALVMGKPVIVSKVSDLPLLIKENENGFLCDQLSISSIANAIKRATNLNQFEYLRISESNVKLAHEIFNKSLIINQYLKLLQ